MTTERLKTACNRDCPDACSLVVTVKDGRVHRIDGDPDHPVTRGFVCYRTSRFDRRQNDPERLVRPLLRTPAGQVPVSWAEAFDRIEAALRSTLASPGPVGICSVQSGGSLGITKGLTERFFRELGSITEVAGDICGGAGTEAQMRDFGICESHDVFDLENSKTIVLWGKNVGVANVHLVPILKACRERGARVIAVDPVPLEAGVPGIHRVAPRPGRDPELALAVARRVLDLRGFTQGHVAMDGLDAFADLCRRRSVAEWAALADVPEEDVRLLADALLDGPASIQVGWGLQRRARGGQTVRALDALGAVTHNLGAPGGGVSFYYWRRRAFDTDLFLSAHPAARSIEIALLGQDLLAADPPVRFLWISCANPVASLPDSAAVARAIEQTDFSVAVDSHANDTTRRATLVLPSATLLEHGDLLGSYGHHWVQMSRKVVDPPAGVRSDLEIIQELARRFGCAEQLAGTAEEWAERLIRPEARAGGVSVAALQAGSVRNPMAEPVLFADGRVPTPTGRVQLLTAADWAEPDTATNGRYPLWLFSNSHRRAQSAQWVSDEAEEGLLVARVHPETAAGLGDGATARIEAPLGQLTVRVKHDARMRTDAVAIPKSGCYDLGRTSNAIVPARLTDMGGGAAYLDVRVRLVPA